MKTMVNWLGTLALGTTLALGSLAGIASAQEQVQAVTPAAVAVYQSGSGQVTPQAGEAGTEFFFSAAGFRGDANPGDDDEDDNGEQVAYWINTPSGAIISQDPDDGDEDKDNAYIAKADANGLVQLTWTAHQGLEAGEYVLVVRGLSSGAEVTIPFSLR